MPGADNLVKYYLSLATGPSEDLIHAIEEIAANNYESFEVTWRDVLNYKLDRISNYDENFTEKLEFLTRNEIAVIEFFLKNPPLQNFAESKLNLKILISPNQNFQILFLNHFNKFSYFLSVFSAATDPDTRTVVHYYLTQSFRRESRTALRVLGT